MAKLIYSAITSLDGYIEEGQQGGEHRLEGRDQPFVGELHAGGSLAGRKWGWSESVLI